MVFNHRLVEGSPLQYYVPPLALVPPPLPYFKRFEAYTTPEMSEEMLPPSPNSTQVIIELNFLQHHSFTTHSYCYRAIVTIPFPVWNQQQKHL